TVTPRVGGLARPSRSATGRTGAARRRVGRSRPRVPQHGRASIDGINLLKYWFYPLLKRVGLPRIRFHDLRHTAATFLLGRGINPKVVSETLGHSHVSVTLGIYSHVLPHMQEQAARAMDDALRG